MKRTQRVRLMLLVAAMLCVPVSAAYAQQRGKKEFAFRGKVEKVDANAKTLTVIGEKVDGWMPAMTMSYKADKADVLKTLKAGDQITAKVYEGDFMTLYDIKIAPAKDAAPPAKK